MKIISNKFSVMPDKDFYAVLCFKNGNVNGSITTIPEYIVFDTKTEFSEWISKNYLSKEFFPLISRKLDLNVKVNVEIKNLSKEIDEEVVS